MIAPMSKRSKRLEGQIGTFMQQHGRRKPPGRGEPNDRRYDREVEQAVKRMDPYELDEFLRGEAEDLSGEGGGARPSEGAGQLGEDRQVGVELDPPPPSDPERR